MFKNQDTIFIIYHHPSEQKQRTNRQAVSSFISRSYRPTTKRIVFDKSNYRPFLQRCQSASSPSVIFIIEELQLGDPGDDVAPAPSIICQAPEPLSHRQLGSPFQDPFITYPVPARQYVPFFIDYRKLTDLLFFNLDDITAIRSLTPRLTPALDTSTGRYLE
jgi:hypothetical protein